MYPHLAPQERQAYLDLFRDIDTRIEKHIFEKHEGASRPCAYCMCLESIAEAANARATEGEERILSVGILSITPVSRWKR